MTTAKHVALTLALTLFALLVTAHAQTARVSTVNVTSEGERVKIAAQGDISEMRIEVSDEQGDMVFQSGAITGQQLDWNMKDSQGERVAAGTYLVTVTYRNAAGKLRKRVEQVTVEEAEKANTKTQGAEAPEAVQATVSATAPLTANKIPKFKTASASAVTLTNSIITESAGKISVGLAGAPLSTLTVKTATENYGLLHTDGSVQVGTWAGAQSGWFGTKTNHPLRFFAGPSGAAMTIFASGSVSIGSNLEANTRLSVRADRIHGVIGSSNSGYGVLGYSESGYGVVGESPTGYAGYFRGGVRVNGHLEAYGGMTLTDGCNGCARVQSDQNLKANLSTINPRLVLDRLSTIPIKSWNYKSDEPSVRHIGPMAQDFRAAFNLGTDDKHIDMIDANGVTMASIQALYQMMQEKDQQIETLTRKVEQQQVQLNQVKRTIKRKQTARK